MAVLIRRCFFVLVLDLLYPVLFLLASLDLLLRTLLFKPQQVILRLNLDLMSLWFLFTDLSEDLFLLLTLSFLLQVLFL